MPFLLLNNRQSTIIEWALEIKDNIEHINTTRNNTNETKRLIASKKVLFPPSRLESR
jgi:hypothetical protein